jgi:hypothetical protein
MVTRRRLKQSEGSRRRAARPGSSQRPALRWDLGLRRNDSRQAARHAAASLDGLCPRPKTAGRWQRDVTAAAAFGGSVGQMTDR